MQNLGTWWKRRGEGLIMPWLRSEAPEKIGLFDWSGLLLLLVTALWYLATYWRCGDVPGHSQPGSLGWWNWHDQNQYLQSTIHLAHGTIQPSEYWIGYSLLGVPFYAWLPQHPFLIPNLVLVMVMVGAFFATCRHFMGRLEAWVLVILLIFTEQIMRDKILIIPWNTLPTYAAIYLSTYLLLFRKATLGSFALCAAMAGLAMASRPAEVLPLAAIYLIALLRLATWRQRIYGLLFLGCAGALAAGMNFAINLHLYGHISSPYMKMEKGKLHVGHYVLKVYQFLSDGSFLTGPAGFPAQHPNRALLEVFPWAVLALPGVIFLIRRLGYRGWGLPLAIVAAVGFYLLYTPVVSMPYFWSFGSFHYIWWIVPWLGFFAWLTFRQAARALPFRLFTTALLAPVAAFLLIGFKTVPVATWTPARDGSPDFPDYQERVFTVRLVAPPKEQVVTVRFEFSQKPSFNAMNSELTRRTKIWLNRKPVGYMGDFMPSQFDNTVDLSFLSRSKMPAPGDRIMVSFLDTDEPVLSEVSLQAVKFKWGRF